MKGQIKRSTIMYCYTGVYFLGKCTMSLNNQQSYKGYILGEVLLFNYNETFYRNGLQQDWGGQG